MHQLFNGVKQGGVLSPILFCVYMGVGNISIPAIGYADDVALLAPTISSLKLLLNVVNSFGNEYCVKINPDKIKLLGFGKSYNSDISIVFNDSIISSSLQTDHLGHVVGPAIGHEDINSLCNDIYYVENELRFRFVAFTSRSTARVILQRVVYKWRKPVHTTL